MEQKILNKTYIALPCNNGLPRNNGFKGNGKFTWDYNPIRRGFVCSGCKKELVKFEVIAANL